jgi:hypothetical protein
MDGSGLLAREGAPGSKAHALFTSGEGFERWGAFIAARLNASRHGACTYDVSGLSGLAFWAKGTGSVRVNLGTRPTTPITDGGACAGSLCSDYGSGVELGREWTRVELPFTELTQPGWATPAEWQPAELLRVSFWSEGSEFEFWIDDVSLY